MSFLVVFAVFCAGWSAVLADTIGVGTIDLYRIEPEGNIVAGDTVRLVCRTIDLEAGYAREWATGPAGGLPMDPRYSIVIHFLDSRIRDEMLEIAGVEVQDSGFYYCRVKNITDGRIWTVKYYNLEVAAPPSTSQIHPASAGPTSVPQPTCGDGQSPATPWPISFTLLIATASVLLGLLLASVFLNIYVILKHRKSKDKYETPTPSVQQPYTGLQPTDEQNSAYTGLATNGSNGISSGQHPSGPPANEATTPPIYYEALGEGEERLQYDYPRPDDAPNPIHGTTELVPQYRNIDN